VRLLFIYLLNFVYLFVGFRELAEDPMPEVKETVLVAEGRGGRANGRTIRGTREEQRTQQTPHNTKHSKRWQQHAPGPRSRLGRTPPPLCGPSSAVESQVPFFLLIKVIKNELK
jgi:hypothetical protein